MEKQYIQMMIESLQKKEEILASLLHKSEQQKEVLSEAEVDWDVFDNLTIESPQDLSTCL